MSMHSLSQNELCDTIIDRIVLRQLGKTITFHPTLHKFFTNDELKMIFNYPKEISFYQAEIEEIKRFVRDEGFRSLKDIMQICKSMFPNYIAGMYDARYQIEMSTDLIPGEVLIERDLYPNNGCQKMTKDEFLGFYLSQEASYN